MAAPVKKLRWLIFLKDVLTLALTAIGGPQAHLALFLDVLVEKRGYLTEEELLELQALCQILPGPTSTQTITAVGFFRGGANLAYLTLMVWCFPAVVVMSGFAVLVLYFQAEEISLNFTRYLQPMAVGFVTYAAWKISKKVIHTKTAFVLLLLAAVASFFSRTPWALPCILLASGLVTALKFKKHEKQPDKQKFKIQWGNLILYGGFFVVVAALGGLTQALPIRLLENFYRNGSLIFGGGQVLVPVLYTEFVEFKQYLSSEEFLSGYAFVQAVPGPVFSFSSYVGVLSMREYSVFEQLLGGLIAAIGIFLPGTFLIFFVIRFWEQLKQYRPVRASLEGIQAGSAGMVVAAVLLLGQQVSPTWPNALAALLTLGLLASRKVPSPVIILLGLCVGFWT